MGRADLACLDKAGLLQHRAAGRVVDIVPRCQPPHAQRPGNLQHALQCLGCIALAAMTTSDPVADIGHHLRAVEADRADQRRTLDARQGDGEDQVQRIARRAAEGQRIAFCIGPGRAGQHPHHARIVDATVDLAPILGEWRAEEQPLRAVEHDSLPRAPLSRPICAASDGNVAKEKTKRRRVGPISFDFSGNLAGPERGHPCG